MKNWNIYTPGYYHATNVAWMGSDSAMKEPTVSFPRQFVCGVMPSDLERDHAARVAARAGRLAWLALSPCQ